MTVDEQTIQKLNWEQFYQETPADLVPWETGEPDEQLVELVKSDILKKGARVLDAGCGLGTQTIYLAKQGFDTTGIDIAQTAIKKAQAHAKFHQAKANFIVTDVIKMPFEDAEFDLVYDRGCLHHLDPEKRNLYADEVKRVLVPRGLLALTAFADIITPEVGRRLFINDYKILQATPIMLKFPDGGQRLLISSLLQKIASKSSRIVN